MIIILSLYKDVVGRVSVFFKLLKAETFGYSCP